MIVTKTTGICDRCKKELERTIYKVSISETPVEYASSASNFPQYTGGIANAFNCEGYHLCNICLRDFKQGFIRNEKTSSNSDS